MFGLWSEVLSNSMCHSIVKSCTSTLATKAKRGFKGKKAGAKIRLDYPRRRPTDISVGDRNPLTNGCCPDDEKEEGKTRTPLERAFAQLRRWALAVDELLVPGSLRPLVIGGTCLRQPLWCNKHFVRTAFNTFKVSFKNSLCLKVTTSLWQLLISFHDWIKLYYGELMSLGDD